jgi:hypothetical protein
MPLGLVDEDMEMLNLAQGMIDSILWSCPDSCEPVKLGDCNSTCIGSCSGTCWRSCSGGAQYY